MKNRKTEFDKNWIDYRAPKLSYWPTLTERAILVMWSCGHACIASHIAFWFGLWPANYGGWIEQFRLTSEKMKWHKLAAIVNICFIFNFDFMAFGFSCLTEVSS